MPCKSKRNHIINKQTEKEDEKGRERHTGDLVVIADPGSGKSE